MRQRKVTIQQPGESADKAASKSGPSKQARPPQRSRSPQQLHWLVPLSLVAVRLLSAVVNTVHDCDEAFNYWEPLHFLLHGYGLQTWENSPQFALRSYAYVLLHAVPLLPHRLLLDSAAAKRLEFHTLRAVLGVACALAELHLCRAAARMGGTRLAYTLWAVLLLSSGMFTAPTTFLPSTFTMVAFAAGTALSLDGRHKAAVVVCVAGGLLGWPFAGLAAVPVGLRALAHAGVVPVLVPAVVAAAAVVAVSLACDSLLYGKLTLPMLNLIRYNVAGGGDSALYGVEGPLFYLRNTFNAFNLALLLALVSPVTEVVASFASNRRYQFGLLSLVGSLHLWMGVMSAVPHKEERFMYVIYPQLCLGAAVTLHAVNEVFESAFVMRRVPWLRFVGYTLVGAVVAGMGALSVFRTVAVVGNYDAPMKLFAHLPPAHSPDAGQLVCMGAEWYRFPSSFYLPGAGYRLGFVKSGGFSGLLPLPFNAATGGVAHAPPALNDRNREVAEQYVASPREMCTFWVGLAEEQPPAGARWSRVAGAPFLDAGRSPALWRAFHVPGVSRSRNVYTELRLLRNNGAE